MERIYNKKSFAFNFVLQLHVENKRDASNEIHFYLLNLTTLPPELFHFLGLFLFLAPGSLWEP